LFTPPAITYTPPFSHVPQYQKWSLEIQQGFGANTSVTISYSGNHGIHESVLDGGLNAYDAKGFGDLPKTVPDPRFGFAEGVFNDGISNYNGLSLSVTHRYATGQISASYTYSHALDEISNGAFSPFTSQIFFSTNTSPTFQEDPYNLRASMYASADNDVRHYFELQYQWELPFKKLTFGHGPDSVLKGWNVAGTLLARSGFPFTAIDSGATSAVGITNFGPTPSFSTLGPWIFVTPPSGISTTCSGVGVVGTPCLNLSAFPTSGSETSFAYGARNAFRGPGYWNSDFSVWKALKVIPHWESAELDLGFQFYNIFNHPNFDNPVDDIANPSAFQVQRALSPATTVYGVALGADASPRIAQLKAQFKF
jgi:hypothetical protein